MSYDNGSTIPFRQTITTTTAAATLAIRGPKGKTGRLVDVIATCSTTHVVGATTAAQLLIGNATTTNAYGTYVPPALTAGTGVSTLGDLPTGSVLVGGAVIPADTAVLLTTVANTGAGAAGVLNYDILIDWS